jgi:predicted transcriptional regulator
MDRELPTTTPISEVMVTRVITMPVDMRLYEVIKQFKEQDVGRVIVTEDGKPVGILTHSDIIRVFPSL